MRVLYLLRYYPTLTETFVYREMAELHRRGVRVDAVAIGRRGDGALQDELPPVDVRIPPRGARALRDLPAALAQLRTPEVRQAAAWGMQHLRPKDVARALWTGRLARQMGADRLHVHFAGEAGEWARVVAAVAGLPCSLMVHAVDLYKPRASLRDLARFARPLMTVARANQRVLLRDIGVSAELVRCGVVPSRYAPAHPGEAGPLQLISVGRWVPKKGMDLLVEAVRHRPDTRLRLVADAPLGVASKRITIGAAPPSAIPGLLQRAHAFALPCRVAEDGDRDGIPVALMEAMAAGLPVITTAVNGIPELVDEEVGWLLPPGDAEALSSALAEAAHHPEERARRGRAARARIQERGFTVRAQVDSLQEAWAKADAAWGRDQ